MGNIKRGLTTKKVQHSKAMQHMRARVYIQGDMKCLRETLLPKLASIALEGGRQWPPSDIGRGERKNTGFASSIKGLALEPARRIVQRPASSAAPASAPASASAASATPSSPDQANIPRSGPPQASHSPALCVEWEHISNAPIARDKP